MSSASVGAYYARFRECARFLVLASLGAIASNAVELCSARVVFAEDSGLQEQQVTWVLLFEVLGYRMRTQN
jgi:hypothetical protein